MTPLTYDLSLLSGLLMIGGGVACWSVPAALVTVGGLVIALTFATAALSRRKAG
jgi:hypothetical protein